MTVINVTAALTALGGGQPIIMGRITVEYLRGLGGDPAVRVLAGEVTLPAPIIVAIVDGAPVTPVDVPPTDGTCYARVWVESEVPHAYAPLHLPAVAIPAAGPVDIASLVAVDVTTFEPDETTLAAWRFAVAQVEAIRGDVTNRWAETVEAASEAGAFAEATEFDANRAGQSAFQAGQSAASALGHRNEAKESADAALAAAEDLAQGVGGLVADYLLEHPVTAGSEHTQTLPSASWVIPHALGRRPSVAVYIDGVECDADVSATPTTVSITFATPVAGTAVLT